MYLASFVWLLVVPHLPFPQIFLVFEFFCIHGVGVLECLCWSYSENSVLTKNTPLLGGCH